MDHLHIETANPVAPAARRLLPRRLRAVPDDELVARVRAGDAAAFEAVYDRYHRPLLGFCRHMLGSQPEAEDALQHVFIAAHRTLRDDERPIQLKPWLYAVAGNRCRSVLRARREHVPLDAVREPATAGLAMAEEVERREDLKHLLVDVAALPEDQRAALVLAELGDLSHDEIAATLDVRTDKVKALVFQARESLIGTRRARETDCTEIRAQLATLRGGALRRTSITRHLAACPTCAAFKAEVRAQRAALGCVLPVVPALALKQGVLAAALAGGSGGAAAAGLAVTGAGTTGAAAAGSGLAGAAGTAAAGGGMAGAAGSAATTSSATLAAAGSVSAATKVFVALALTGGAVGGGVAIEQHERPKAPRVKRAPARAVPSGTAVPIRTDAAQARPGGPVGPGGPSGAGGAPGSAKVPVRRRTATGAPRAGAATPRPQAAADKAARRGPGGGAPSGSSARTGPPARSKPPRVVKPGRAPADGPKAPASVAPERVTRPKPSAGRPAKTPAGTPKPDAARGAPPSPPKAKDDEPARRSEQASATEDATGGSTP